jgi:glycosyltransferase involved in cell wall biosynthesis
MPKAKRIFVISDFKNEKPQSAFVDERRIVKGLIRLGHDVLQFSHRNILMEYSPFRSKRIARRFAKRKTNKVLLKLIKYYYPDIVLLLTMKHLDVETVIAMHDVAPNAVFIGRDGDPFPENFPDRIAIGKHMDIITMPSGGRFLQTYKDAGVKCCAFVPSCCDPDTQYKYETDEKWQCDIVFTGKAEHTRLDRNELRYDIVKKLSEMPNVNLYGCFDRPRTQGIDCFRSLSNAKIGLSINIANDVNLYHSDRYINIPACGTFTLAKRAPGYELLFKDGTQMRYFDTTEEFFELADWYLKNDDEREKIATAGMQRAHSEFNCEKIAGYVLDLIETGSYKAPWAEIL